MPGIIPARHINRGDGARRRQVLVYETDRSSVAGNHRTIDRDIVDGYLRERGEFGSPHRDNPHASPYKHLARTAEFENIHGSLHLSKGPADFLWGIRIGWPSWHCQSTSCQTL